MQMQFFIYNANVPCRDENAKFIHDDASARIQTMMQMSSYRVEMQMSSNGYVMMQMSFCRNAMMQMF